jgi:hypothetical protein
MAQNTTFRTKITAVRFKSCGELRLMTNPREAAHDQVIEWLKAEVDKHIKFADGRMAGAVLVTWLADGCIGSGVRIVHTSPYVGGALPHIAADAVRSAQQQTAIDRALGRDD